MLAMGHFFRGSILFKPSKILFLMMVGAAQYSEYYTEVVFRLSRLQYYMYHYMTLIISDFSFKK